MLKLYQKLEKDFIIFTWLQTLFIFSQIFLVIGVTSNFLVMTNNEGLMPVRACNFQLYSTFDTSHFYYCENNQISYWRLSDIFYIGNNIYSIGDLIMFFSIFLQVSVMIGLLISSIKIHCTRKIIHRKI